MQGVGSYIDGGEIFTTDDAPPPPEPTDDHIFADEKIKAPSASPGPAVNGTVDDAGDDEDKEADLAEDLFGDGDDDQDETVDHDAVVAAAPDLFDDDDAAPAEEPEEDDKPRRPLDELGNEISEEEWRKRKELEYEEREGEEEPYFEREEVMGELKLANLPAPFSTDDKVRLVGISLPGKAADRMRTGLGPSPAELHRRRDFALHGAARGRGARSRRTRSSARREHRALAMGRQRRWLSRKLARPHQPLPC